MAAHPRLKQRGHGVDEGPGFADLFGTTRTSIAGAIPGVGAISGLSMGLEKGIRAEDVHGVPISEERALGASFFNPAGTVLEALETGDSEIIAQALLTGGPGAAIGLQRAGVETREREEEVAGFQAEQALKFSGQDIFTDPGNPTFVHGGTIHQAESIPSPIPTLTPTLTPTPIPKTPIKAVPNKFLGIKVLHKGKQIPASRFQRIKKFTDAEMIQKVRGFGEALKKSQAFVSERNFRHGGDLSQAKAREILSDGTVHGNPLTDKQKKFFGAHARHGLIQEARHGEDIYKHGTGSFIKPSRKGLFTAKANAADRTVQEHANFVMSNKDQFDSETVKQANFAKNAGRGFKKAQAGLDTELPAGLNVKPEDIERATAIASGAIEVEKNEFVLRRTSGGRYKEVADFKDAPVHADGGQTFVPQEGDIIFPSYKRRKVKEFLKNKDFQSIDAERLTLPKSGSIKARFGMINAASPFATHNFKAQAGLDDNLFEDPLPAPGAVEFDPNDPLFTTPEQNAALLAQQPPLVQTTEFAPEFITAPGEEPVAEERDPRTGKLLSTLGGVAALAPAISNIFEGLTSKAKVTDPIFNPRAEAALNVLESITFDVAPGIQDIERSEEVNFARASNLAAGNASVLLGNLGNIRSESLRAKNRLRTQKSNIENQAKTNLAKTLQQIGAREAQAILFAEESTEAAEATKRDFIRTGISQLSEGIQRQQLQKKRELSDAEKIEILKAAYPDLANVLN